MIIYPYHHHHSLPFIVKVKEQKNKDGKPKKNSKYEKIKVKIEDLKKQIASTESEIKEAPERVDLSDLEDYRSFKTIDNEAKYLFDITTSMVWNARKTMINWLKPIFNNDNEVVDLFYAISACHGWVKVTDSNVRIKLEPLQQTKRMHAQVNLCQKLTALKMQTPNGKRLIYEVGRPLQ